MKILVTWGSKNGGTEGIARIVGETLRSEGLEVDLVPARQAGRRRGYDAVIVGGAIYANRWHREARRFVSRHVRELRRVPVWFFSSGPLDHSADRGVVAPPERLAVLMERVGALGHVMFGGRLAPDARGFVAAHMAQGHGGDWRNPDRIRAWATEVARALPTARPNAALPQPGRSLARLVLHGLVGWAASAGARGLLMELVPAAKIATVLVAPMIFGLVARSYFARRGAREPLPTALALAVETALLDLALFAGILQRDGEQLAHWSTWLSYALIAVTVWAMGLFATVVQPLAAQAHGRDGHAPCAMLGAGRLIAARRFDARYRETVTLRDGSRVMLSDVAAAYRPRRR